LNITKYKKKRVVLIWTPRCLNAWQMPPFISQNSKLLIWWLIVEWVATSWLGNNPYFLSVENVIPNIKIWTDSPHESSGKLSQLSNKTRMKSFGLLKLEIWAEHWTLSRLQDRFWLLCCCYNLNLKTVLLNLRLFMKVLGLCLSFLSI
jgi:hypothetical protein